MLLATSRAKHAMINPRELTITFGDRMRFRLLLTIQVDPKRLFDRLTVAAFGLCDPVPVPTHAIARDARVATRIGLANLFPYLSAVSRRVLEHHFVTAGLGFLQRQSLASVRQMRELLINDFSTVTKKGHSPGFCAAGVSNGCNAVELGRHGTGGCGKRGWLHGFWAGSMVSRSYQSAIRPVTHGFSVRASTAARATLRVGH